jgi:23S rRNA pseudouridine1911/1915/1917 synthase
MTEDELELAEAVVAPEHAGMRADRYVSEVLELFPRSQLKTREVDIRIDGRRVKPSRAVREGERIEIEYGPVPLPDLEPEDIPLDIIYEYEAVLVVDKPQGMVVHPAHGNYSGTLAHAVLHRLVGIEERFTGDRLRPGIVHRLDKDTSGVIVVAKTPAVHEALSAQFRARTAHKRYLALTKGTPKPARGTVEGYIRRDPHNRKRFIHDEGAGKAARTDYRVLRSFGDHAVVVLEPKTGRTHQLRVHMRHLGCPILGDPVYARRSTRFPNAGLMLHALSLRIILPGEQGGRTFTAPVPTRFREVMLSLVRSALR